MPGLIYWLLMITAHLFIFRGMARSISRIAEQITEKREKVAVFFRVSHCIPT
ncbi:hypothetical protein, partial [Salmonella enterica]|uniref:hypothetical protein n=1 Tax=Salmonella enterica TaxID=28901 RepID=UPI003299ECCB